MRRAQSTTIPGLALLVALTVGAQWSSAAPAQKPAAVVQAPPIFVFGVQRNTSARLTFMMKDRLPNLIVRQVPEGIEVRTDENAAYQIANLPTLREVAGVDIRKEGTASIALIRLTGNYQMQEQHVGNKVRLDLVPAAGKAGKSGAKPAAPTPQAKAASELNDLRTGLAEKLALLNGQPPAPAPTPTQTPQMAAPMLISETPPQPVETVQAAAPNPRPSCPPEFTMEGWSGKGQFSQRLQTLRTLAAQSEEAPSAMAALAEFYIGNGLGAEALVVTQEVRPERVSPEDRRRLQRDADLARLLKALPIEATSVLLNSPVECDRTDIPLWRTLSAAASGDQEAIRRDSEAAGYALQFIPEPLANLFAVRIAEAAPDDLPVLHAMAGGVRNSDIGGPADAAGRFLLQARVAHARKDPTDEANFLERATHGIGVVGLKAKVRLAELRSAQDDAEGRQSEAMLADTARIYRDTTFGQSAAAVLSELRLRHNDYTGALRVANDSAAGRVLQQADSHGATLAARVLRQLLVEKDAPGLPSPEQRLLIYWRYSGYATPGEKGDDIRMGAAQLMLDQGLPEAALDVMRQVTAQSPRAALLHAVTEARAGDPAVALTLLKDIPPNDDLQRVTAEALVRQGKPVDAAHQLEGNKDLADGMRRASLLYAAKDWPAAADQYATLLRNASLDKDARVEAADRYALALALSGRQPAEDLGGFTGLAEHVIGALPEQAGAPLPPVPTTRESLRRAAHIEALLPPSAPAVSAIPAAPAPAASNGG